MVEIVQVSTEKQIKQLAKAASEIWHECFVNIISRAQIDYMVEQFQSLSAITQQIEQQGYLYFVLVKEKKIIGYTAMVVQQQKLFLSKVYLKEEQRGKGYASMLLKKAEEAAALHNLPEIYLTVNKGNKRAIAVYLHKGYEITQKKTVDIGNGFVMDDYILTKRLS